MMKRYLTVAILLASGLCSFAQSINSTVDVSNDFAASFSAADRKDIPMSSPDSLRQFRKDFDYSVFENPYKGSYEFVSDYVTPRDSNRFFSGKKFYLNAGAGWTLHPVLQAVYSPVGGNSPKFQMSIFQDGRGYYGKYEGLESDCLNFSEEFGVNMHAALRKMDFKAEVSYKGLFAGPVGGIGNTNAASARLGFCTVNPKYLEFKADLGGHYAWLPGGGREAFFDARLTVEPKLRKSFRFPLDIEASGSPEQKLYNFAILPHIRLSLGPLDLNAGVRLAYLNNPYQTEARPLKFSPDVHAVLNLFKGVLTVYADADGNSSVYSALDAASHNHFITLPRAGAVDNTLRLQGGLRGRITSRFHYDLKGGYSIFRSAPLDSVPSESCGISDVPFKLIFADAALVWRSERVDANAGVHYRRTDIDGDFRYFDLPSFSGSAEITFNWERRIFAGINCEASTVRVGGFKTAPDVASAERYELPSYIDLGVYAEYKFTRAFSVWAKGQNLLNRKIYRIPVYAEPGIYATGGIKLNF
ncbi:MAG: TonB-dependent receptor [Bacteroidales bacterium]|nr:TonB-dependent receptor [Bacteroidales bacterium]